MRAPPCRMEPLKFARIPACVVPRAPASSREARRRRWLLPCTKPRARAGARARARAPRARAPRYLPEFLNSLLADACTGRASSSAASSALRGLARRPRAAVRDAMKRSWFGAAPLPAPLARGARAATSRRRRARDRRRPRAHGVRPPGLGARAARVVRRVAVLFELRRARAAAGGEASERRGDAGAVSRAETSARARESRAGGP